FARLGRPGSRHTASVAGALPGSECARRRDLQHGRRGPSRWCCGKHLRLRRRDAVAMQRLSLNRSDLSGARVSCAGRTPLRRWLAAGLLILHIGGCYSYVPVGNTQLVPGTHVSVALNDQGRVGMASDVGPGVLRITGQLRENHDTLIVMSMNSVNYMDLN